MVHPAVNRQGLRSDVLSVDSDLHIDRLVGVERSVSYGSWCACTPCELLREDTADRRGEKSWYRSARAFVTQ